MKGQGTVLLMFGVSMLTLISGVVVLAGPDSGQITSDKFEGLKVVAEAESRTDLTIHNYIPLAVRYSTDQALGATEIDFSGSEASGAKQAIIDSVETRSKQYLEDNYISELGTENCKVELNSYGLSFENLAENNVSITSTGSLVATTCGQEDFKVRYGSERSSIGVEIGHNRIFLMARLVQESLTTIKSNSDSTSPVIGSGSETTSCSYSSSSSAENAAESDSRSSAQSELDRIENSILQNTEKSENGVTISTSIESSDTSSSVNNIDSNQCGCDNTITLENGDTECIEPVYEGSADYSYDYNDFEAEVEVTDSENELAQESGWKQSSFEVSYSYDFDG